MKQVLSLLFFSMFLTSCLKEIPEPVFDNPIDSTGVRYPSLVKADSVKKIPNAGTNSLRYYFHVKYSKVPSFIGAPRRLIVYNLGTTNPLLLPLSSSDTCKYIQFYNVTSNTFIPGIEFQIEGVTGSRTSLFFAD